ncbi:hypothetical protein VTO42DRAFT_2660 [Malbranchea cinnamomea]
MKSVVILALLTSLGLAQSQGGISDCAQMCLNNMLDLAEELGCARGDMACVCANIDFEYGIRDCTTEACPGDDPSAAIAAGLALCPEGSTPSETLTGSANPTETGSVTTTSALSSTRETGSTVTTETGTGTGGTTVEPTTLTTVTTSGVSTETDGATATTTPDEASATDEATGTETASEDATGAETASGTANPAETDGATPHAMSSFNIGLLGALGLVALFAA